jgi:hypothetical protein
MESMYYIGLDVGENAVLRSTAGDPISSNAVSG